MKISKLKIQGFRTINRGFDCSLKDLSVFVGRNNAGKSCVVRALNLFFNHSDDPNAFEPHIRINPGSDKKVRFSIIIGVWLIDLPESIRRKYSKYIYTDGSLPIRLYFTPKDASINYKCFIKGRFSTVKDKGEEVHNIIKDCSEFISLKVIPETRDLAREFQTELGHGFKALKETVLSGSENRATSRVARDYKKIVEGLISTQLVEKINKNLGDIIPDHEISIGQIENAMFSRMVLSSIIDQLPIFAISDDSDNVSIDQMGAGFQSAVLVSLYRTVAQLEDKKLILCVEEPEIHLDFHSQRYCYHHWSEQITEENDLNQVLITSHSAFLVDEASPSQIVLIKRDGDSCSSTSQLSESFLNSVDLMQLSTKILGLNNTDLFFSSFVILVEGDSDTVAYRGFLELLLQHKNALSKNLSLAGISVIDCGGKDGIRPLAKIIEELGIPYVAIFDRDVIQKVDIVNKWELSSRLVEKTYLNELSNDFKNQKSLFPSEAVYTRVANDIKKRLKAGKQASYPQKINEILSAHNILMMRTEHETDLIDANNLTLVSSMVGYDLTDFNNNVDSLEYTVANLKALNKKEIKKAFVTAKLISLTQHWSEVPAIYASMCSKLFKIMKDKGLRL